MRTFVTTYKKMKIYLHFKIFLYIILHSYFIIIFNKKKTALSRLAVRA